jgi:hypothetical protein
MPNRDTTGPMGTGMRNGRRMGPCEKAAGENTGMAMGRCGQARGSRRGLCRRVEFNQMNDIEFLKSEKIILEERLSFINTQLNQNQ